MSLSFVVCLGKLFIKNIIAMVLQRILPQHYLKPRAFMAILYPPPPRINFYLLQNFGILTLSCISVILFLFLLTQL